MDWDELFVIGFFTVLVAAGVALAWLGVAADPDFERALIQVNVQVPEGEVPALLERMGMSEVVRTARGTFGAYREVADALLARLREGEAVFAALGDAARLLQAEAEAVRRFADTARVLFWVAVGLLGIAVLLLSAQLFVVRSLWAVTVAYTEVDLRQQQGLWHGFKELLRRLRGEDKHGDKHGSEGEGKGTGRSRSRSRSRSKDNGHD